MVLKVLCTAANFGSDHTQYLKSGIVYRKIGSVYSVYVCTYVYVLICTYERERYYTHIYVQSGGARHPIV